MVKVSVLLIAGVALLASGCATNAPGPARNASLRCDEAISQGTAFGPGEARAIAVNSLKHQVDDVRGYLLAQGLHRVRPAERSVTCGPSALGAGLVQCTAVTRFCGR
jgi:hypothetical protein